MAGGTRRRGAALETAILRAFWDEFDEVGYASLTVEGVAARARTGKAVLYRRWAGRVPLVLAAVRDRYGAIADEIPDTGALRSDLLALLGRSTERIERFGPELLEGMLGDLPEMRAEVLGLAPRTVQPILDRAAARGEVDPAAVTPRIARLPLDLVRFEVLLTRAAVPDAVLEEIVDDIVLPLLTRSG